MRVPPPAALTEAKIVDHKVEEVSSRYTVGEMLGEGRFSQVYAATRGGRSVALKVVDLSMLSEDEEAVEALVQEVSALRRAYSASGRHVPRVHEVLQTAEAVYVVMDQVKGCELFEMLDVGPLSESSSRRLIAQLLSALAALHRHNVVHRDVKPENLMVCDVDDPSKCRLVMIDFGYAAVCNGPSEALEGLAGSPEYAAPEVLSWLEGDGTPYYKSCDMWSVGVTAYVLLCGELPFEFDEETDLEAHVRGTPIKFTQPVWRLGEREEGHSEMLVAQDFVRACMRVDEKARLTARLGLSHKWFEPRRDDGQSVAIGSSKAAMAALQRRVSSLTMTNTPKHIIRWFGRLKGQRPPVSPTKQQFWELQLGMPPRPTEQLGRPTSPPPAQVPPLVNPLVSRPLAQLNATPQFLSSARKSISLAADHAEEQSIKSSATPRKRSGATPRGTENGYDPLPSPRRALFLAPSPRSSSELLGSARRAAAPSSAGPFTIETKAAPPENVMEA